MCRVQSLRQESVDCAHKLRPSQLGRDKQVGLATIDSFENISQLESRKPLIIAAQEHSAACMHAMELWLLAVNDTAYCGQLQPSFSRIRRTLLAAQVMSLFLRFSARDFLRHPIGVYRVFPPASASEHKLAD